MPKYRRVGRLRLTGLSLCASLLVLAGSTSAHAIPLAGYHKNLQQVINAVDTLSQTDEDEAPATYEYRFTQTIASVRLLLPKTELVQTQFGNVNTDNQWLHDELDHLEKVPSLKRREKLFHLLQQLRALEQRVNDLQGPSGTMDKAATKDRLNGILSRPEYAPKSKAANAFWRWINELVRWLGKFLPRQTPMEPGRAFSLVRIAQYLVIGLCIVVVAYVARVFLPVLLRRKRKQKDKTKPEARVVLGEHVAADESAKDLLADAEALARSGQIRAAIRKAYIALLVDLGDRKVISLAQHKTNRDYLRSVRETPALYANMTGLTEIFERNWYGLAQPTPADWQAFRDGYQQTLRTQG